MRKNLILVFLLLFLWCFSLSLYSDGYGLESNLIVTIGNLLEELESLTDTLYILRQEQKKAEKSLMDIETERWNDSLEREKELEERKKEIKEREKDIQLLNKQIESKDKEIETLTAASIVSEKQFEEEKKAYRNSKVGIVKIIAMIVAALGIGYIVGSAN